ncbi:MAG: hypothetical protein FWD03_08580 [Defluviitaleaceae bacterium]|nr:hypothetical protein [Defluviitaleaceae bacterium]
MCKQIYYGAKNRLNMRLVGLASVIIVNLLLVLLANSGVAPRVSVVIISVTSSLLLFGIWAINIVATFSNLNKIFSPPDSYFTILTPVPSWKILLGHVIPAVIFDIVGFVVGIGGMMLHFMVWGQGTNFTGMRYFWFVMIICLVGYGMFLLVFTFWRAVSKSVFYRFPVSGFWGVIATLAVLLTLSWLNVLLIPFGIVQRFGLLFVVSLGMSHLDMLLMTLVTLLQAGVLLFATAYLMDRRINI